MINQIPELPENHIKVSGEMIDIYKEFNKLINNWCSLLKNLNYQVIRLDKYNTDNPDDSFDYPIKNAEFALPGFLTLQEAHDLKLVICGSRLVTFTQILTNDYWPNSIQDTPKYIEFGLGPEKSFVRLEGNEGECLFDEKMLSKQTNGSMKEIGEILISISQEIAKNFKLQNPPKLKL